MRNQDSCAVDDGGTDTCGGPDGGPPPDVAFDLLSDPLRRRTIATLAEAPEPLAFEALCERLATDDATSAELRRVRIALHHKHLPKLADEGVIEVINDGELVVYEDTGLVAELLAAGE